MDGVLVDLAKSLELCEGRTIKEVLEAEAKGDVNFDPFMWLIRKHNDKKPFLNAEPMKGFEAFHEWIQYWNKNKIDVQILSSASRDEVLYSSLVEQKKLWLEKHGLGHLPQNYSKGGRQKLAWAKEGCLLVDDYYENVDFFKAAGGQALLHKEIIDTERFLLVHHLLEIPLKPQKINKI